MGERDDPPVRPATPADRPAVGALQAELPRRAPALLEAAFSGIATLLVSPAGGRPVGYLLAVPGSGSVHVAELVVAPAYRREGRASALLSALSARVEEPIGLAVAPDNRPARRCYESLGFEVVDRDPDYFDGDPALLLVRE